ncbi:MAG: LysR family transcriptional regulator [Opitutae bacterium]|nr:LysR family transcriptional regulator [Opitutae bacterium]
MKSPRTLDTRQLQAFEMLVSTGSFTGAAKKLFITQSAVSHSIKNLEESIGCKLLAKQGKKAVPTEAGERLLHAARSWLGEMEKLCDELDGFDRFGAGRLRLGASPKGCQFLLPPIIDQFKLQDPRCRFEVHAGDTPRCLEMLRAGEIDIGITLEPIKENSIEFRPWFQDELKVVLPVGHPWSGKTILNQPDVLKENFILYNRESYTFRIIFDFLRHENIHLPSYLELSSVEATKELVKAGVGIGILADWTVVNEVKNGELTTASLSRRKLTRTWGLSSYKGRLLNPAEDAFARIGEEVGCKWMLNRNI